MMIIFQMSWHFYPLKALVLYKSEIYEEKKGKKKEKMKIN
jgi:hypothetical protein